jgi:hypothetical protein
MFSWKLNLTFDDKIECLHLSILKVYASQWENSNYNCIGNMKYMQFDGVFHHDCKTFVVYYEAWKLKLYTSLTLLICK